MLPIVTLTTDFGIGSTYVAELKARLLHARTQPLIVDIAHDVPAHDVAAAAWIAGRACPAFPPGSIHLIVVDPGVGTARRLVWVRAGGRHYIAPDNGVLTRVLAATPLETAVELVVPVGASATFHGRDVIAPAVTAILDGTETESPGRPLADIARFAIAVPRETPTGLEGEVVHVDGFGNLLTNLPAALLPRLVRAGRLRVGDTDVVRIVGTYGDAVRGTAVALVGSQGVIEAAVVEGRAADLLAAGRGTRVVLP